MFIFFFNQIGFLDVFFSHVQVFESLMESFEKSISCNFDVERCLHVDLDRYRLFYQFSICFWEFALMLHISMTMSNSFCYAIFCIDRLWSWNIRVFYRCCNLFVDLAAHIECCPLIFVLHISISVTDDDNVLCRFILYGSHSGGTALVLATFGANSTCSLFCDIRFQHTFVYGCLTLYFACSTRACSSRCWSLMILKRFGPIFGMSRFACWTFWFHDSTRACLFSLFLHDIQWHMRWTNDFQTWVEMLVFFAAYCCWMFRRRRPLLVS